MRSLVCALFVLYTLAGTSDAASLRKDASARETLENRAATNLTLLTNATAVVQSLDYTSNCTLSISWYKHLPANGVGSGHDALNINFLRSALPTEYQNESDDQIASFYDEMSTGSLANLGWKGTAKDDIETACITPEFEKTISISNLNATQDCLSTARFLSSLGWTTGPHTYTANNTDNALWLSFLRAALPTSDQNLTDLELLVYRNYFFASENEVNITAFLQAADLTCANDICGVQGYTGNPDIAGIGVIVSYSIEAVLVTIYFVAVHIRPLTHFPHINDALQRASEELLDGALFFSLSISTAGWVSLVSGTSYYEKLVFTSANVLALSALFAFLGMYTKEGGNKRGQWIPSIIIFAILVESAIQYIVYLTQSDVKSNAKYSDYSCLHSKLKADSYNPILFEALFFVLLGLSVVAGFVATFWLGYKTKTGSEEKKGRNEIVERLIVYTRVFVQIVAITVMWVELVYMWKIRTIMASIAGATWIEGAWGFGQILALFIWFPPVIDILGHLLLPAWMLPKKKGRCECEKTEKGCACIVHEGTEKAGVKVNIAPTVTAP